MSGLIHPKLLSADVTPKRKKTAWVQDIRAYLSLTKIMTYKLESLIGKINHAAHTTTPEWYLLTRLCHLLKMGKERGPQRLQSWNRQETHLWKISSGSQRKGYQ